MNKKDITSVSFENKNVVLRVDFNVPIKNGIIQSTNRIDMAIPTIKYIMERNARRLIIVSHMGRPNGEYNEKYSLKPVRDYLQKVLKRYVKLYDLEKPHTLVDGVVLCENIRFYDGETRKSSMIYIDRLCSILTSFGDIYVNDAFGTLHRDHCSITGVNCPIKVSGLLVKKELEVFGPLLNSTANKPVVAILGGSKINDKIKLVSNLLDKVNHLIIGGGMAFTFKKVLDNYEIGSSLFDEEGSHIINDIIEKAKKNGVRIHLPIDFVISNEFSENGIIRNTYINEPIPDGFMGLDIGPESVKHFSKILEKSKTVLWNGPMGVFEMDSFSYGSRGLLHILANNQDIFSIIGGGDTASCAYKYGYNDKMSHVSTGGGASLKLLEGSELIGLSILDNK